MPASTGKTGRGIKFQMADGESPTDFVTVANVVSISVSGQDAEEVDFTHLDSEGGFREFRQGFKDPGSIGLETHFDPTNASHLALLDKFLSGDNFPWRINFVGAGWSKYLVGNGFIKNPGDLKIDPNSPVGGTATVRTTGASAWETP